MQARFYLPMWGRFASPDPKLDQNFQNTQSWNIYSYVRNNPTMMIDPRGEDARETIDKKNKTIRIDLPVVLNSKSVSPADFKKSIEAQWNNGGKGHSVQVPKSGLAGMLGGTEAYKVTLNAVVVSAGDKGGVKDLQKEFGNTVNTVTLAENAKELSAASLDGTARSQVVGTKGVFRNYQEKKWDGNGSYQNVWGHEIGHFLGLRDLGSWSKDTDIMKNSSGGSVNVDHVRQVVDPLISSSESQVDIRSAKH